MGHTACSAGGCTCSSETYHARRRRKVVPSIIHKSIRQLKDKLVPWIFREVCTAIQAADGKDTAVSPT